MKIKVTQEHINKGVPGSHCMCPIALAMLEAVNDLFSVHGYHVHYFHRMWVWFSLPTSASMFVERFDRNKKVKPFEFDLPI